MVLTLAMLLSLLTGCGGKDGGSESSPGGAETGATAIGDSNGMSPLPPHVDTGVDIVTKDNLSIFYKG